MQFDPLRRRAFIALIGAWAAAYPAAARAQQSGRYLRALQAAKREYEKMSKPSEAARTDYITRLVRIREKAARLKTDEWQAIDAEIKRHPAPSDSDGKTLSSLLVGEWASPSGRRHLDDVAGRRGHHPWALAHRRQSILQHRRDRPARHEPSHHHPHHQEGFRIHRPNLCLLRDAAQIARPRFFVSGDVRAPDAAVSNELANRFFVTAAAWRVACRIRAYSGEMELARAANSVLPSPLWGGWRAKRAGWGSCGDARASPHNNDPHPQPLPTRGRGAHRVRSEIFASSSEQTPAGRGLVGEGSTPSARFGRLRHRRDQIAIAVAS